MITYQLRVHKLFNSTTFDCTVNYVRCRHTSVSPADKVHYGTEISELTENITTKKLKRIQTAEVNNFLNILNTILSFK
jgi:hypothetical protein